MDVNMGDLSTFTNALDQMGFYGASATNPNDMRNNCVSVSVCRLLGYNNVHDLWRATHGYDLPDQPLTEAGIVDLFSRAGWTFQWQRFRQETNLSAYQVMLRDIVIRFTTLRVVLYIRANGSGHAVNAVFSNLLGEGPQLLRLVDWQSHHMGAPVVGDLEGAVNITTLDLNWPTSVQSMTSLLQRYAQV
ncbi:hypothetical protein SUNI508_07943 [Seiridium unicorne]|uniref:Uncharacterized protein n=1 Tax=Seiridium unicorne TaxID=138068 RepID=A0ABR2UWC1_9PEZI